MTAIAMRRESALDFPISAPPMSDTFDRLASWARAAQAAHDMAVTLVQTSFVPEAFRGKAHEATAAILAGAEIGLDPMAALRSFDIIQGTAAPRANTLRAVVQANGHQIILKESTATRAVVTGCRRGEAVWQTSTWTIERAKQLGLTGKKNWQGQPQAMLVARATAECARLVASDAILGIPYASEELDDGDTVTPVATEEVKPARRTAQRRQVEVQPAPEPDLPEPAADAEVVETPPVPMMAEGQKRKLFAVCAELGYDDEQRYAFCSIVLKRDVNTTKTLTRFEAGTVLDALDAELVRRRAEPVDVEWPTLPEPEVS